MIVWLSDNLATVIVCLLVAGVLFLAVRSMLRKKKQGKSSCGCGCSTCPRSGSCHTK
ncbi:MAG: FeoB-associated Cys-rich membrane protein [Oscillospiraceae bacterium]|nr:FeoB-associated Cys-rich membrane protein [Oscillospiraceae bacterium]